jgi:hypothetical protein
MLKDRPLLQRQEEFMNSDTICASGVAVDYHKSLQDMIAEGHYDWVNGDITPKWFSITGTGIVQFETKVFHFARDITSDHAVAAIKADDKRNPWEPAKIESLLAYGAKHPDEQRQYPIIALGSVAEVYGFRHVPCLFRNDAERDLDLSWCDYDWYGSYRFLAVRKLSSAA